MFQTKLKASVYGKAILDLDTLKETDGGVWVCAHTTYEGKHGTVYNRLQFRAIREDLKAFFGSCEDQDTIFFSGVLSSNGLDELEYNSPVGMFVILNDVSVCFSEI
jgi:hypothetical protein